MLALYARLNNTTTSDAYWEIGEALCNDFHRDRPNSGYEMAGNQQAGTGSPVSGTQTDLAGYERRGELKTCLLYTSTGWITGAVESAAAMYRRSLALLHSGQPGICTTTN